MSLRAPEREPPMASAAPAQPAVAVAGLSKEFLLAPRGRVAALEDVSLHVARGEVLGLVGPSGCGKSTLLEIVAGLQEPTSGEISVEGSSAAPDRLAACVLMPQRDLLLPWRSALDNAGLALELQGEPRGEARRRARELFERFGLGEFTSARPDELSGGMRQRVAFARTLLAERPVLLLDEPFASLDAITRAELQEWTADLLVDEKRSVVLVTHDIEEALYLCDRVLVLSRRPGRVRSELPGVPATVRPRSDTVTSPEFSRLRHRALEALA
jgi:ABC-type nitrate/sulfonate/bicarbonate transport system ATPase subunit